jgi:hypothetical protein
MRVLNDNPTLFGAGDSISKETFRNVLQQTNSPALAEVDAILSLLERRNADRGIALAFFAVIGGYGRQGIANETKNWGFLRRGKRMIGQTKHPFAIYANWTASVEDWCELLSDRYCQQLQLCTLREVLNRYAPSSDGNNPNRLADEMLRLIRSWQISEKQAQQPNEYKRRILNDNPTLFGEGDSISKETFRIVLERAKSPAYSETEEILSILERWRADRGIALAFFAHESSFGRKGVATETKNWGNLRWGKRMIGQTKSKFAIYANWATSVEDWCDLLSVVYCQHWKLCTLREVLQRYAPSSDGNNPRAYADTVLRLVQMWQAMENKGWKS